MTPVPEQRSTSLPVPVGAGLPDDAAPRARRVAAVDCGTNSIRLLIADVDPVTGALVDRVRRMEVVRLGQGVDKTGVIAPVAMERTLAMAREYAEMCAAWKAGPTRFVATSATRDAANRDEFAAGVRGAFGVDAEVVSGAEEAELSFLGARSTVAALPGPYLTVDLGGGSTELTLGDDAPLATWSMNVGCVRMTERRLKTDPPMAQEISAATRDIDAALAAAGTAIDFAAPRTLVGLAGSVTTVTAYQLGLDEYEPDRINGAAFTCNETSAACHRLLNMTRAERAALGFMHPGRIDVIGGGALVWARIVAHARAMAGDIPVVTSEHDILDGIAISAARR